MKKMKYDLLKRRVEYFESSISELKERIRPPIFITISCIIMFRIESANGPYFEPLILSVAFLFGGLSVGAYSVLIKVHRMHISSIKYRIAEFPGTDSQKYPFNVNNHGMLYGKFIDVGQIAIFGSRVEGGDSIEQFLSINRNIHFRAEIYNIISMAVFFVFMYKYVHQKFFLLIDDDLVKIFFG